MPRLSGWYVLLRNSDAAISCAYYDADLRQWQYRTRNGPVPSEWTVGPRVDETLEAWISVSQARQQGERVDLPAAKKPPKLVSETRKGLEP